MYIFYFVPTYLWIYYQKWKYTSAVRSNILSKLIFASCVWYFDCAYCGLCALIKDIGRRLPLELQCSYQGQQGDQSQSVRGNYKTRLWGGQNLTAVEGNALVYQVNPVSRMTGEGRAEFTRDWTLYESPARTLVVLDANGWTDQFSMKNTHIHIRRILCISFHSCQILTPSKTGFTVSAHRLINITLLTLV